MKRSVHPWPRSVHAKLIGAGHVPILRELMLSTPVVRLVEVAEILE